MRIHIDTLSGTTTAVVRCTGDLIYRNEADFFLETVSGLKHTILLLDMERIRSVDAYGLGRLVCLVQERRNEGARLALVNPRPRLRELLQLMKVDICVS